MALTDVQLDHLAEWYEERTSGVLRIHRDAWTIVGRIREAVSDLEEASARMTLTAGRMGRERERFARYAERLAENVSSSLKRVDFPRDITYESLQRLYDSLLKVIDSMNEFGRRYVPRMSPFFKAEILALDYAVKKLADKTRSLYDFIHIDYAEAKRVEDARRKIDELINEDRKLEDSLGSIERAQKRVQNIEKGMGETLRSLQELHEEERFERLTEIEIGLNEIKVRFLQLFGALEKPIKKMKKLVDGGGYALERDKRSMLDGFLANPFESLVSVESFESFKALLIEMEELIENGRLELKKRRRKKALECLREATRREFLRELRKEYGELQRKRAMIEGSLKADGKRSERERLERRVEELKGEIQKMKSHLSEMKIGHAKLTDGISRRRKLVEDEIAEIVGGKIRILDASLRADDKNKQK